MAKTDLTIETTFYKTIIHKCKRVFDVGCRDDNVFYELDNTLEVHLFDPNKVNIEEEIRGKSNIYFNNYAIGNYKGETVFHYNYGSIIHRTEEPKFEGIHQSRIVNIDTLENYCREKGIDHIDFLKIDTEGYDFEVIKGLGKNISVKYLQFEDWEEGYAKGESVKDVFEFFKDYNIYKLNTKPLNYIVTKEALLFDIKDVIQLR